MSNGVMTIERMGYERQRDLSIRLYVVEKFIDGINQQADKLSTEVNTLIAKSARHNEWMKELGIKVKELLGPPPSDAKPAPPPPPIDNAPKPRDVGREMAEKYVIDGDDDMIRICHPVYHSVGVRHGGTEKIHNIIAIRHRIAGMINEAVAEEREANAKVVDVSADWYSSRGVRDVAEKIRERGKQ